MCLSILFPISKRIEQEHTHLGPYMSWTNKTSPIFSVIASIMILYLHNSVLSVLKVSMSMSVVAHFGETKIMFMMGVSAHKIFFFWRGPLLHSPC